MTAATITRADLTLYLVERGGGSDAGGESRLTLGLDAADREAQHIGHGHADVVTVSPLEWGSVAETDALFEVDDPKAVCADALAMHEYGHLLAGEAMLALVALREGFGAGFRDTR